MSSKRRIHEYNIVREWERGEYIVKALNNNTYLVLASIRDKDNNLGLCKARGMTKADILKRSELSESTVQRAILIAFGFRLYKGSN